MAEVLSNVGNKYEFAKEVTFGVVPGSFTALDLGHVQTITLDEDDSVEEVSSMNSFPSGPLEWCAFVLKQVRFNCCTVLRPSQIKG